MKMVAKILLSALGIMSSAMPVIATEPMAAGVQDTPTQVEVTKGAGSFQGTVLFGLGNYSDSKFNARIVEVDSTGKVVWEHKLNDFDQTFDTNKLDNGNVIFITAKRGILEVDRSGNTVWNWKGGASHHVDVLPNGNILTVSADNNWVKEVNFDGETVWEWNAKDYIKQYGPDNYDHHDYEKTIQNAYAVFREPNRDYADDWTHVNSTQRLENGNTIMCLRNLDLIVEVNPKKEIIWTYGALILKHPHSIQVLPNGNMLIVDNGNSRVIEVDRKTLEIVWQYKGGLNIPIMGHAQRLADGQTLITDSLGKRLIIVNSQNEITWELKILNPIRGVFRAKLWK